MAKVSDKQTKASTFGCNIQGNKEIIYYYIHHMYCSLFILFLV